MRLLNILSCKTDLNLLYRGACIFKKCQRDTLRSEVTLINARSKENQAKRNREERKMRNTPGSVDFIGGKYTTRVEIISHDGTIGTILGWNVNTSIGKSRFCRVIRLRVV